MTSSTTPQPHVDVDRGGEEVTLHVQQTTFDFSAAFDVATATRMIKQLEWAIHEVERFQFHMARDGRAGLYGGLPKP